MADGKSTVKWSENVVACMDSSFGKLSYADYTKKLQSSQWTLIHGDFHPANMYEIFASFIDITILTYFFSFIYEYL